MPLSDEDLDAIGRLMDRKLEVLQAQDRRRRRFWVWFWIVVFVLSSVASWWAVERLVTRAQDEVARINIEFSEAKLAYQRQLENDRKLQAERAAAEKTVSYDTGKTQAQHEAGLISGFISLLSAKNEFEKRYADVDLSDPHALDTYAADLNRIIDQALVPLGQIVLRNTDPAHNTRDEQIRRSDDGAAAPLDAPPRPPAEAPALPAP